MFPICQQLYTLGVEMDFTRNGDFTWRVSDCEELVILKKKVVDKPFEHLQ